MTHFAPTLDILADHLQEPLTRILMGVTFVFGYIRTRWYWVLVFALMVAVSHVLANHDMSTKLIVLEKAGENALRIFLANGVLMLASFAVGYGLKMLGLLLSGPRPPPAERKRRGR